jgi:competence protein ComEA
MVHVAGAVKSPGVYELPDGSRVTDAVSAAGGAASDADLDALNLAALLTDGLKIYVPKVGEAPPQNVAGEGSSIVNLNTASAAELEELPGIGPVLAQRIIDFRTKRGRFTSVRQLMEVDGIGPKKFESLEDLVTV